MTVPLVTVERYRVITGDTSTAASAASAAIEDATAMLADDLGRPDALKSEERTELMQVTSMGRCRPLAVPVTDAPGTFDTAQIYGAAPDSTVIPFGFADTRPRTATVTYTGGWLERQANLGAVNALPEAMERDIAWVARVLVDPGAVSQIPPGAVSVSLGDAAVSFAGGGARSRTEVAVGWSRATLGWRRRHA